jgi:predicted Zn-dependent peptidase
LGVVLFAGRPAGAGQGQAWKLEAKKIMLDSGLAMIVERDRSSETTVLQVLVRGGRRAEPAAKAGLAFLTTRLAVEIPDSDKVRELMSMAAGFSVLSRGDYSLIHIKCLSPNLEQTLKILSKIILDPLFSSLRIDTVKDYMRHQSRIEEDDSVVVGHLASLRAFFSSPGYAGSVYGEEKTIEAIKGKDIAEFYKRHFTAGNLTVLVTSDLEEQRIIEIAGKALAGLDRGAPLSFEPSAPHLPDEKTALIERDTKQSYVSLAYPLPAVTPRNYALSVLLENLLGKGPGSFLWPLRSEKRLAYNVNSRATQMVDGGILEAYLETDNSKTEAARIELRSVLDELAEHGISGDELETAKAAAKANFLRDNETRETRAGTLAAFEALGLGFDYFNGLLNEAGAATLEEMNAFIKAVLAREKAFEVVVGSGLGKNSGATSLPGSSWQLPWFEGPRILQPG